MGAVITISSGNNHLSPSVSFSSPSAALKPTYDKATLPLMVPPGSRTPQLPGIEELTESGPAPGMASSSFPAPTAPDPSLCPEQASLHTSLPLPMLFHLSTMRFQPFSLWRLSGGFLFSVIEPTSWSCGSFPRLEPPPSHHDCCCRVRPPPPLTRLPNSQGPTEGRTVHGLRVPQTWV